MNHRNYSRTYIYRRGALITGFVIGAVPGFIIGLQLTSGGKGKDIAVGLAIVGAIAWLTLILHGWRNYHEVQHHSLRRWRRNQKSTRQEFLSRRT